MDVCVLQFYLVKFDNLKYCWYKGLW